jgi:hypothetical protein
MYAKYFTTRASNDPRQRAQTTFSGPLRVVDDERVIDAAVKTRLRDICRP